MNPVAVITHVFRRAWRDPNPILLKELRVVFRTNLFTRFLYLSTAAVALIVLTTAALRAAGAEPPATTGQMIFQFFFSVALMVVSVVAPGFGASTITGEKELRTYESLVLSGMSASRIVWGKFFAAYGAMSLVLIAFAPVVGIAFLFGGVSPADVVIAYLAILILLAIALAFGIAVSSRAKSTRIAILVATVVYVPVSWIFVMTETSFGMMGVISGHGGGAGPFWFVQALASLDWDLAGLKTLAIAILLPLFWAFMVLWLFLATAISGLRPLNEDRSAPFKRWTIVSFAGLVLTMIAFLSLSDDWYSARRVSEAFVAFTAFVILFYALLFANEPTLPARSAKLGPIGRTFGSGAAATARFAAVMVFLAALIPAVLLPELAAFFWPGGDGRAELDAAMIVMLAGHLAIGLFAAAFGGYLRAVLKKGAAARAIVLTVLAGLCLLPVLGVALYDPENLDHLSDHLAIKISPIYPTTLAFDDRTDIAEILVTVVLYLCATVAFWVLLAQRTSKEARLESARRAKRETKLRESAPSLPALQTQRTSLTPDRPRAGE